MKRRDFFKTGMLGAAALSALPLSELTASSAGPTTGSIATPFGSVADPVLSIVKGTRIADAVRAAVEGLGGIKNFVSQGDIVLLKPNMSFPNPPEWGSTTHPDVIRTVVEMCAEAGAKRIIAVDFPMRRAERCLEKSGMTALSKDMPQLTFVQIGEEKDFVKVPAPDATEFDEIAIAKLLKKADVFINLPTAKAHSSTSVSLGLKNLMGLIYDRRSFHGSYNLHAAVADLAKIVRPQLTILDAQYALLTNGPGGPGKTQQLGRMIAGTDPLAVDAAGVRLAEWNNRMSEAEDIRHLAAAAERGVGSLQVPEEQIVRTNLG
ncbi:MAG: hypothetical protein C0600_08635 [Ignavibacteria bacterium]|nr:MAG: hypothetical protein C0600_08635 [Ignavibacteria bacterium]